MNKRTIAKKTLPVLLAAAIAGTPASALAGSNKPTKQNPALPFIVGLLLKNKAPELTMPEFNSTADFGQFPYGTEITGTVEVTGEKTTGTCDAYLLPDNTYGASFDLVKTGMNGEYNQMSVPTPNTGFGLNAGQYRVDCLFDNQGKTLYAPAAAHFEITGGTGDFD